MSRTVQALTSRLPIEPAASERLRLLETLQLAPDAPSACELVLAWLREHAAANASIAAVLDADEVLIGVAGLGVPQHRITALHIPTTDADDPLVRALSRNEVLHVKPRHDERGTTRVQALDRAPLVILPLWGSARGPTLSPVGVLVTNHLEGADLRTARWAASTLATRLATLQAIQAREASERHARTSRSLLDVIVDAVPDPVLVTDAEGRLRMANQRAERLFKANEGESEGRRRAVALNNMLFSSAHARRSFEPNEPSRRELLLVDPLDGSDLLFEMISVVTPDLAGGTAIISILRNVTDLRRATQEIEANLRKLRLAEADVRAERDRLDLIIDSVADPILVTDPAGAIVLMNVPAEQLFSVSSAVASEDAERIVRANDAHFSSFVSNLFFSDKATRWRGEIGLVDPSSGAPMPVEAIAGKIQSETGDVIAVVTILHDRTEAIENARLYEQLKRASTQLEAKVRDATSELVRQNELLQRQALEVEQASNLKSQFLANVSHEFRTPLNAILGYTSMLLQGVSGDLQVAQRKHLSRVDSNARHLLGIINDILDIARIESGKMPLHLADFVVAELVAEVLAELEPIVQRSGLRVEQDIQDDLPIVKSDRQKLKQIVLNLVSNALKFTHEGRVSVHVRHDAENDRILVAVRDTGIGIAECDQERIFEDFRQADNSTTRKYGGTGLGLSICRRLARMLGGEVTLSSRLNEGSTFTLFLPRKPKRK